MVEITVSPSSCGNYSFFCVPNVDESGAAKTVNIEKRHYEIRIILKKSGEKNWHRENVKSRFEIQFTVSMPFHITPMGSHFIETFRWK